MFIVGSTVILAVAYWFVRGPRPNKKNTPLKKGKITSFQKPPKGQEFSQTTAPIQTNKQKVRKLVAKRLRQEKRFPTQYERDFKHSISEFINKAGKDYSWSTKVFAVLKFTYKGSPDKVLGKIGNMVLISASRKPPKSFFIVKSNSSGEVGYYTGKIIAVTNNKNIEDYLNQNSIAWNHMAGTYILNSPNIETALLTVEKLKASFPNAVIEIDVYATALEPK